MKTKKNLSPVAVNIRRIRKEKGLSQDKLSKLADVAFHTIVKIEGGDTDNPKIDTVQKIAESLGVSIDELTQVSTSESPTKVK